MYKKKLPTVNEIPPIKDPINAPTTIPVLLDFDGDVLAVIGCVEVVIGTDDEETGGGGLNVVVQMY